MRLTSLRIKNYGCLADVEFQDIPPLAVFVGANGTGKSTLFDVFAFLRDALRDDVRTAVANRGGFEAVRTTGREGPIQIDLGLHYDHREPGEEMKGDLSYTVAIEPDADGQYLALEQLDLRATLSNRTVEMTVQRQRAESDSDGQATEVWTPPELSGPDRLWLDQPLSLFFLARRARQLDLHRGGGVAPDNGESLAPPQTEEFEVVNLLENARAFLRGTYISNIDPLSAKVASDVGRDHRLSERGENLANVLWHQHQGRQVDALDRVQFVGAPRSSWFRAGRAGRNVRRPCWLEVRRDVEQPRIQRSPRFRRHRQVRRVRAASERKRSTPTPLHRGTGKLPIPDAPRCADRGGPPLHTARRCSGSRRDSFAGPTQRNRARRSLLVR